jgi:hypothetical protein
MDAMPESQGGMSTTRDIELISALECSGISCGCPGEEERGVESQRVVYEHKVN